MIWVIVAVVIIGAGVMVYMLAGDQSSAPAAEETNYPSAAENQAAVSGTTEIEQELQAIQVEGLDAELDAMEKEVSQ